MAAQAEPAKVVVGLGFSVDHLPLLVAKDNGYFQKHDLDLQLKNIPVPANIGPALVSGDIQVGAGSAVSFLLAREAGLRFTVVSGQTRNDKNNVTMGLVTRKDFTVKRASDLKGKKVAVPGLNSSGYVLLAKWLIDGGVKLSEVTFLESPMPTTADLLRTKSADAAIIPDPFRTRVVATGAGDFSVPVPAEVSPDSINLFWMATEQWAKKYPQAPRAFRTAIGEAIRFIAQDPEATREIEKKFVGFNSKNWPTFNAGVKIDDLAFFHAIGRQIGALKSDLDTSGIIQP